MDLTLSRGADGDAKTPNRRRRKQSATKEPAKKSTRKQGGDRKPPDPLKREILGIAILGASLCLMLALGSFHLNDVDPQGSAAHTGHTRNLIGPVGAYIADILLYVLGLAAFLLPLTLALPGVLLIVGRRLSVKAIDVVGYPLLVFTGSMLAHLWMAGEPVMGHDAGGLVGTTGAEILKSLFGQTGAYIILYCTLALTFMLTTGISIYSVIRAATEPLKGPMERIRAAWETMRIDRAARAHARLEKAEAKRTQREEAKAQRASDRAQRKADLEAAKVAKAEARLKAKADAKAAKTDRAEARKASKRGAEVEDDQPIAPMDTPSPLVEINLGEVETGQIVLNEEEAVSQQEAEQERSRGRGKRAKIRQRPADLPADLPRDTPAWAFNDEPFAVSEPPPGVDPFDAAAAHDPEEIFDPEDDVDFDDPLDQAAFDGPQDTLYGPAVTPTPQRPAARRAAPQRAPEPAPQRPTPPPQHRPTPPPEDLPTSRVRIPTEPPADRQRDPAPATPAPEPPAVEEDKPVVKARRNFSEGPLPEGPLVEEEQEGYILPPLSFLDFERPEDCGVDPVFLQSQADRLVQALDTFRIQGRVTEIHPGPVVTMFEFEPAPGVRISKIAGLADDLAMALRAIKVRIVAPIPGKGVVGFEVPNERREMVYLKEIIGSKAFLKKHNLPIALGKDIHGAPVVADLARMPHLLVAGTTGSGKSVGVNCMIASMLYHAGPEDIRMIMVDPKMLELSIYEDIPHLLLPVVTDPKKAAQALKWAVDEMERRYQLMKEAGVRNIKGFNKKVEQYAAELADGQSRHTLADEVPEKLPYIVVIIDEFADLMMVAGKEVEYCVARIAQKARAAGIHLILATQRPSTDVITGVIKANFPTRMAFQVSSGIDSRTILSTNGAENLLGKGDMLYMPPGTSRLTRVHGAFVSEDELHEVVEFIKDQGEPDYLDESVLATEEEKAAEDGDDEYDDAYEDAVRVVYRDGRASTSHLQRRLSLGYNRAARIIDCMEREGLVGPGSGAKPRDIHKAVIADLIARWDGHYED